MKMTRQHIKRPQKRVSVQKNDSYDQKAKRRFRASKKWKDFRDHMREKQKVDPVTGQKLTRLANLHHKNLYGNYEDISNEDDFVFLNCATHDCVHYLFLKSKPREWRNRLMKLIPILEYMEKCSENK